jgi:hypothetical protein
MALSDDNEEEKYFVTRLTSRALQIETCFAKGDYGRVSTMFSKHTNKKSETLFFLSDFSDLKLEALKQAKIDTDNDRTTFLEAVQNHGITISNRIYFNFPLQKNLIYLLFFKNEEHKDKGNNPDIQCKKLASYGEIDGMQTYQVDFDTASNSPNFCEISFSNSPETTIIEWEKNGKICKFENPHLLAGKNKTWQFPEIKKILGTDVLALINTSVYLPQSNNQEVKVVFNHLNKLSSVKKIEELHQMYQLPLTKKQGAVSCICFTTQKLRYIACVIPNRKNLQGYFLRFSPEGNVLTYAEGVMHDVVKLSDIGEPPAPREIDDSANSIDSYFNTTEWMVFDRCLVIEKGVEVLFHKNGFPSNYRTHARHDRLYGRQIEWNDKGEVVSDVDLDIPKEWKDAPKKK